MARINNFPFVFTVEPITISPIDFVIGILSPVTMLSSIADSPLVIIPSTGIFSPGFTIIMSPATTSSTGIVTSFPFLTTSAVFGFSPISFWIASEDMVGKAPVWGHFGLWDFDKAKAFCFSNPVAAHQLLQKITDTEKFTVYKGDVNKWKDG